MLFSIARRSLIYAALAGTLTGSLAAGAQSQQAEKTEKTIIEGIVVKVGTGQPVRGAKVTLRRADATDPTNSSGIDALPDFQTGTSGTSGAVAFFTTSPGGRGGPLPNLQSNTMSGASATTDAMGRFLLSDVAPGDYRVTAQAEGLLQQEYGQRTLSGLGSALSVTAGKRLTVDFRLTPASVISGRIYDTEGEPAQKTSVQAYTYRYTDGRRTLAAVSNAQTNDLGEYRLYWLPPGEYFVAVTPRNGISDTPSTTPLQEGRSIQFVTVTGNGPPPPIMEIMGGPAGGENGSIFYPSVTNPADAEVIRLAAATEVQRIDFHLRPMKTITVSGRVISPFSLNPVQITPSGPDSPSPIRQGQENRIVIARGAVAIAGTAGVPAISPAAGPDGPVTLSGAATRMMFMGPPIELTLTRAGTTAAGPMGRLSAPVRPDGTFQFESVTPGSYNLIAIAKDPGKDAGSRQYSARVGIDAGSDDIRDLQIALQPGHDIQGRIYIDPPQPDGFKMTNLRVSLTPDSAPVILPPNPGGDFVMAIASPSGVFPGGDTINGTVAEDGSFLLNDVAAALNYRVRVTGIPSGGYLMDGRMGTADALGVPINGSDAEAALRLQLGFSGGHVSGTVLDASDKPYATAVVALVPVESRSGRGDLYFSTTSDAQGRYSFANVPPGPYRLFAWTEIPSGAFRSPEFLQRYEAAGLAGAVEPRGAWTETLKMITPATQ